MSAPEKSDVPMVNVQIDGEWHQFPKGTRMIEACRQVGRDVPHYCYHPKLSSPGNCRMCLVQMGMPPRLAPGQEPEKDEDGYQKIGWMPRPVIACANTVADNMGIRTGGTLVEECRNGVMEFLLINHPLDCPICDQAGECRLQEFSVEHGRGESRFVEKKVKKPKNVEIGPRIRLDDERCIMCSRCIRFSREVADDDVLGFTDRGSHTVLAVHPGKKLANNYSLNTVDICPVGALTSNDFRFQMRVWFLKETPTIDVNCGTGCNITVASREGKIFRVTPRENNDVNSSWVPDSHRNNFYYLNSERRLTAHLVRAGKSHKVAPLAEAVRAAAEGLQRFEPGQIAVIASARMTNEELFMAKRVIAALNPGAVDIVPRTKESDGYLISADRNPNTEGAKKILGVEEPGSKLAAIRKGVESGEIKAVVALHENLLKDAGFSADQLAKIEFLVSSHILANPTASNSAVVFAGAGFAEKRGSMINVTGRLQRLNRAIEPPGQATDDWEVLRDLAAALGAGNGLYAIEDVFKALAAEVPEFEGLTLSRIGDLGTQVYETGVTIPLIERERARIAKGEIVG